MDAAFAFYAYIPEHVGVGSYQYSMEFLHKIL